MSSLSILFLEDQQVCAVKTQDDLAAAKADANLSFEVTHVATLRQALAALAEREFDAILSDLSVPDSHGTETVRSLRQANADCPIVALTAQDSTRHMLACLRAGADDYLVKGQSPSSLVVRALLNAIERRRTRSRLRSAQAKAEAIVNAVLDAVLTFESAGEITSVNPGVARMYGYRPEQLLGQNLSLLTPPPLRDAQLLRLQRLVETSESEGPQRWEDEGLHQAGHTFPINCTYREITDGAKTRTFCAVIRDTSEEKTRMREIREACERAEAATKAKSEFLANMSHELRTPLTAILGFAESLLIDQQSQSEEEFVESVRTILRNGEHLTGLINDILDLAKIEAGRYSVVAEPCSPYQLTNDVLKLMEVRSMAKRLPLVAEWSDVLPRQITIDETRLRQVLINLVGNAIKFTDKGQVAVSLRYAAPPDGTPTLIWEVTDTGIGMTPDACEKIFEPFVQADKKTSHRFGGTGLGLTITKRLVGMMGGDLSVSSVPGQGSTFTVTFPLPVADAALVALTELSAAPEPPRAVENAGARPDKAPLNCRVLLAEDGLDNQRLISFILRKHGATVDIADNGAIACEKVREAVSAGLPYDVILMDMQMPVLDGYGAARQLRADGCRRPIIALTANAMKGDREQCLQAGCTDYATKPIDRDALLELVAQCARIESTTTDDSLAK